MIKKISLYSKTEQLEEAYYLFLLTQGVIEKFLYNFDVILTMRHR